jgi:hypothetical protein
VTLVIGGGREGKASKEEAASGRCCISVHSFSDPTLVSRVITDQIEVDRNGIGSEDID